MTNMSKKILLASPHMSDEGYEQQFIKEDTSYELTENRHKITFVNDLDPNKIYKDLFKKLTEQNNII